MKIVVISDYEWFGGAAIACARYAEKAHASGHEVVRIVAHRDAGTQKVEFRVLNASNRLGLRLLRRAMPTRKRNELDARLIQRSLSKILAELEPDVINVNNLHGGANWRPELVRICRLQAPTVWTLHDEWSYTGRCAYTGECRKFIAGCDASCPTPHEFPSLHPSLIAAEWNTKAGLCMGPGFPLVGVSPSRWVASEAKAGVWRSRRVEVIPYGLDLSVFEPLDRRLARTALSIQDDGFPIILAVAQFLSDRRKGMDLLWDALAGIERATLLVFGQGSPLPVPPNIRLIHLGRIDYDRMKALAYNAADIFVHAARAEAMGLTTMESIACGTPVVAFAVGGLVDMVRPGITGWLAHEVSAQSLEAAIKRAIADKARDGMRETCRQVAIADYDIDMQVKRYDALFASMLAPSARALLQSADDSAPFRIESLV